VRGRNDTGMAGTRQASRLAAEWRLRR
jgi:hypothetical protein